MLYPMAQASTFVVLYDGKCRFCTQSAKRLARSFGPEKVRTENFQEAGVLTTYPTITFDAAMARLHVVAPNGQVFAGAGAVARLVRTIPIVGILGYLYFLPGLRHFLEWMYGFIARNRYRLFGKTQECDPNGTCHLHQ